MRQIFYIPHKSEGCPNNWELHRLTERHLCDSLKDSDEESLCSFTSQPCFSVAEPHTSHLPIHTSQTQPQFHHQRYADFQRVDPPHL